VDVLLIEAVGVSEAGEGVSDGVSEGVSETLRDTETEGDVESVSFCPRTTPKRKARTTTSNVRDRSMVQSGREK
jgi:hypothetical protein